jgi:hypothetical protein
VSKIKHEKVEIMRGEKTKYLPLILLFLLALSMTNIVYAQVPLIAVAPEENSANPSESFTVDITIQDAVDLFSYEAKVGFDPDILEVASIDEGPFIKDQTTSPMGTLWSTIEESDYVYAVCVTMGAYPGVSGSGVLFTVTFNVIDAGACDLDLYDSILLDSTGASIVHDEAGGYFYTGARADLVRRSAWPEHHHFVVSKDEDAVQNLTAKAKNVGPVDLWVKVTFDIMRDDALLATVSSAEMLVAPDTIVELTAGFGELTPTDAGKYYVSARAYYSWSGNYWSAGEKVKTFSFAVVP